LPAAARLAAGCGDGGADLLEAVVYEVAGCHEEQQESGADDSGSSRPVPVGRHIIRPYRPDLTAPALALCSPTMRGVSPRGGGPPLPPPPPTGAPPPPPPPPPVRTPLGSAGGAGAR